MRVVIAQHASESVYFISNLEPSTTVRDILVASGMDMRDFTEIWVDGKRVDAEQSVTDIGLCEGALISNATLDGHEDALSDRQDQSRGTSRFELVMIGGATCSQRFRLPSAGAARIGRADEADICVDSASVSWSHAIVNVSADAVFIVDDNSSNGTTVNGVRIGCDAEDPTELNEDDVIGVGGVNLLLRRLPAHTTVPSSAGRNGLIAFNRPPRTALPKHGKAVSVPVKKAPSSPARFSWISVLAPLAMAAGMVAVMGSMRYAMIALLSPVMAVGSWYEQKRRNKSTAEEDERQYREDLKQAEAEIASSADCERKRLRAQVPYPHELKDAADNAAEILWQVRRSDEDFLTANVGTTNQPFSPPTHSHSGKMQERTEALFNRAVIHSCPQAVDLKPGPIGIWGPRDACVAIARSLTLQLTTRSGPADFRLGVFTDKARAEQWRFTAWLPHTQTGSTNPHDRFIALEKTAAMSLMRSLRDRLNHPDVEPMVLLVDDVALNQGRDCPLREILEYHPPRSTTNTPRYITAIIIAEQASQLPSSCHTVLEARLDNDAIVTIPSEGERIPHVTTTGVDLQIAESWARRLARYDDPSAKTSGGGLPGLVHLFDLLGFNRSSLTATDIIESWRNSKSLSVPLGLDDDGQYMFDIVRDGPHGLVGGTTGSGKSELLRSLVAGLAARVDPQHLTFILVDFKGGAAFASLDQLPHTIGTLSNLEPSLAYRALRSLEAELRWRQQCFAAAGEGIDNIDAYHATNPEHPMPRLLVVVDEFAQLAKEYPDVLQALVSIGAVGRTLGVHMILATQRPAGVVNDDILANTNMRAALRVQSREDSNNVIGVPLAASIGREQKGRAYIKLGEEDITPIQTALVTGVSGSGQLRDLFVDPMVLGSRPKEHVLQREGEEKNDMELLIERIIEANERLGFPPAREVWPDPLAEHVQLTLKHSSSAKAPEQQVSASTDAEHEFAVALFDDPDKQRQYVSGWDVQEGNLVLAGIPGSGTSSALVALALRIADTFQPGAADILILDAATPSLKVLQQLAHVRGYAGPGTPNREMQARLLRYLTKEFDRRTSDAEHAHPPLFVFVDGLATLKDEYNDLDDSQLLQNFYQVWAKGPAMGIYFAATTSRLKALPSAIDDVTSQKWLFRLTEAYDYTLAGVSKDNIPAPVPGRFVCADTKHHGHIGQPELLEKAITDLNQAYNQRALPPLLQPLPTSVTAEELVSHTSLGQEPWLIPVGVNESDLQPHVLAAYHGEHILITGPARSGKSSMLLAIHKLISAHAENTQSDIETFVCASRRSPLHRLLGNVFSHDDIPTAVASARVANGPAIILIDDADAYGDPQQVLTDIIEESASQVLIVATGRNDDLRNQYGQWTNKLRKSRLGVALLPDPDYDSDLLGARIPRRAPVKLTIGRGYACQNGIATLIQGVTSAVDEL